ncbi:MAG: PGF-pre-PGF domain-containing protein [Methanosarcina sp.]
MQGFYGFEIQKNGYNDTKWNQLPATLLKEDDKYLCFTAQTPGFSPFAIFDSYMFKAYWFLSSTA